MYDLKQNSGKDAQSQSVTHRYSQRRNMKNIFVENYNHPCWSPDDRYIVCMHRTPTFLDYSQRWIYVQELATGEGLNVVKGWDPDWGKDGDPDETSGGQTSILDRVGRKR